jgi:hypothetical protein
MVSASSPSTMSAVRVSSGCRADSRHHVLELAHVAGPVVLLEAFDRRRLDRLVAEAGLGGDAQEVAHEVADVLEPLAQRRQAQRHDVEAIVEVLAEQALLDLRLELAVGGGDDAIRADRRRSVVTRHLPDAQRPRRLHRHVADLVEKSVPPRPASISMRLAWWRPS